MPTLLLLHGVHSSRDAWWRMLRDLTDVGVEVQALDLLGHGGRTTGPPPPWALQDFAADVALVVGHSLGALVALTLAAMAPDFTRAVLVEDQPPGTVVGDRVGGARRARARSDVAGVGGRRRVGDPGGVRGLDAPVRLLVGMRYNSSMACWMRFTDTG
jgi:pimeloyl-ACP methyl ester carboxylesterase